MFLNPFWKSKWQLSTPNSTNVYVWALNIFWKSMLLMKWLQCRYLRLGKWPINFVT